MKIIHINTYDIQGGAAQAAYRLHRGLQRIGQDSRMLVRYKMTDDPTVTRINFEVSTEKFTEDFFLSTVIQSHYINTHRSEISDTIFSLPYPGYDLSPLPQIQNADVINLHWVAYYQSPLTLHQLLTLGKPVVWTLHDQWPFTGGCHCLSGCNRYHHDCHPCPQLAEDPFDLPRAILKDKMELFQGADLTIVTPSRWLAGCTRQSTLFKDLKVEVIPNALDVTVFTPMSKKEAKERIGLTTDHITLLFGTDNVRMKIKGFSVLKSAIRCCLDRKEFRNLVKDDKIRIICFGHPAKEMEDMGISVTFLGYLSSEEELRVAYSAADIFILPSLEDNFPNTMLEAMSCGTPVIGTKVGGIPDVIVHGRTGHLVEPGNPQQLSQAILSLLFNLEFREELGRQGRKLMEKKYQLAVQAQGYLKLYRELLNKPKASSSNKEWTVHENINIQEGTLPVYLNTDLGPHFSKIYDQVIYRALKEFASKREKDFRDSEADRADRLEVIHRLGAEIIQLKKFQQQLPIKILRRFHLIKKD